MTLGERNVIGDGAHAIRIGYRRTAKFLDNQGHGPFPFEADDRLPAVLSSRLDDSYRADVRAAIAPLTVAKVTANSAFRFAPPFIATIASGMHASLASLGGAIAVGELVGLSAPLLTRVTSRLARPNAMSAGLLGIALGAAISATSRGALQFGVGLALMAMSKIVFDVGVIAWLTDRVEYAKVGRAIGLTETAWAIGLFTGVVAMGLVTGLTSWRWGYVTAIVAIVAMSAYLRHRLPPETAPVRPARSLSHPHVRARLGSGWWVIVGTVALTAAAQSMFVTFGTWLQDDFGFSDTKLAGVIFAFGAVELIAASSTVRFIDIWGKQRSTMLGTAIVVPAGAGLALLHDHLAVGIVLIAIFIGAFEFSILATVSLSSSLVAGNPSTGLAFMIGAGTLGRALMAPVATAAFSRHGMWLPAVLGAGSATVTLICHARYRSIIGADRAALAHRAV